jgi:hypothetical protein
MATPTVASWARPPGDTAGPTPEGGTGIAHARSFCPFLLRAATVAAEYAAVDSRLD